MKIAQIVCTFPPYKGGIGISAFHFAKLLTKKGHQIFSFIPHENNSSENISEEAGKIVRIKAWARYGKGAFLPQLFWKLKNFDTVILHYPFFGASEVVYLWKIFNPRKRLIIHYHMDVFNFSLFLRVLSWPSKILAKKLFGRADIITCASLDYIKNSGISNIYKKYPHKFKEVSFGVDIEKFKPDKNSKFENKDITNILFVGGLDREHNFKGVDVLLKSVQILNRENLTNWHLNIAGEGNLRKKYEELAEKFKIKDKVKFWGKLKEGDLIKRYQSADIFVLPSINKSEAFGLVLLEAMAAGAPVIASNLPGVRSVFSDKEGLLAAPGDYGDLAQKIKIMIKNKEKREVMGRNSRKLAEEKYNWKRVGEKLNKIIAKKEI